MAPPPSTRRSGGPTWLRTTTAAPRSPNPPCSPTTPSSTRWRAPTPRWRTSPSPRTALASRTSPPRAAATTCGSSTWTAPTTAASCTCTRSSASSPPGRRTASGSPTGPATPRPLATSTSCERTVRSRRTTSPTTTAPAATTSGPDGGRTGQRGGLHWRRPHRVQPGQGPSHHHPHGQDPASPHHQRRVEQHQRPGLSGRPSGWPSSRTAAAMRTTNAWTSSSPPSRAAPVAT